ncbi:hypothetical protein HK100_000525 [Physocladia obscura]|uniref:Homeobox domain-containing protein n=1 Tax=Physocladia obscura TaxID=109957 RepID=A0AAD5SZ78_9FUNG|nr:hypothetical protein HK100_000525 [Physocladia obscura]
MEGISHTYCDSGLELLCSAADIAAAAAAEAQTVPTTESATTTDSGTNTTAGTEAGMGNINARTNAITNAGNTHINTLHALSSRLPSPPFSVSSAATSPPKPNNLLASDLVAPATTSRTAATTSFVSNLTSTLAVASGSSVRATRAQLNVLEDLFRVNPVPSGVEHHHIAERLGMTRKSVRNWFQLSFLVNNRAKLRRLAQQGDENAGAFVQTMNDLQKRKSSEPYSMSWQVENNTKDSPPIIVVLPHEATP